MIDPRKDVAREVLALVEVGIAREDERVDAERAIGLELREDLIRIPDDRGPAAGARTADPRPEMVFDEAVEVALVGGLVAAGLDNAVAVPAVFLFRLFTFWVPVLPGWLAFQWLERNDQL